MRENDFDKIRDCVRVALKEGCSAGYEFQKMRHAIICEMKRLGYEASEIKDTLLKWNIKCEKPLSIGDQGRQLLKYVDWCFKKDVKIGCKALNEFCIGKEKCRFHYKHNYQKREEIKILPFELAKLEKYLSIHYKAKGRLLFLIVQAMRRFQSEKNTGARIYIGFRKIASIIRDEYGHRFDQMDIYRGMQKIIDEKIVEEVEKGRRGTFTMKANGYRFLKWKCS